MGRSKYLGWSLGLVLLGLIFGFGAWFYRAVSQPFGHYAGAGKFFTIARGDSTRMIARRLTEEGIIRQPLSFLIYVGWKRAKLRAGEYYFDAPISQRAIVDRLAKGLVYQHAITIPEGFTMSEIAEVAAQSGLVIQDAMLEAMSKTEWINDLDPSATNLEGYLFPDTYWFPRGVSAGDIVKRMVRRFREVFDAAHVAQAQAHGLTVRQAVILASMVEKETGIDAERPLVSRVFLNRLHKRMLLQCDPTIIYGLTQEGRYKGFLDYAALRSATPYNTYRYPGLPPGPIANPGKKSLDAAVNPGAGTLLYFVSKNNGTHHFSATLAEHTRAVQQYQRRKKEP